MLEPAMTVLSEKEVAAMTEPAAPAARIWRARLLDYLDGHAADMVFNIPMLVSYISHVMTLEPGDLIATGTPEGVGPLNAGDVVEVEVTGVGVLRNPVAARSVS